MNSKKADSVCAARIFSNMATVKRATRTILRGSDAGLFRLHLAEKPMMRKLSKKNIATVEQWVKDNPFKTRQSEFLKQFPNAKLDSNGVLAIRPCDIDSKCCTDDDYFSKCGTCAKDYWLTEVPDND